MCSCVLCLHSTLKLGLLHAPVMVGKVCEESRERVHYKVYDRHTIAGLAKPQSLIRSVPV